MQSTKHDTLNSFRQKAGVLLTGLLVFSAQAQTPNDAAPGQKVFRVCQDPQNLPMSNQQELGYENKIAELFAKKLGWKLEHTWYPQRMGFIRNTLKAKNPDSDIFKCDIVTGVSTDFDLGLATKPYLYSSYALAYVKDRGLDAINKPEDLLSIDQSIRDKLKIGIFAGSPASDWLLKNGLMQQMVPLQLQTGDPEQYPGQLIDRDLASGKVDIAIAWGPIVGYFAKQSGSSVKVVMFQPEADGIQYGFGIAMGVRYGEKALLDQLNGLIESSQTEIDAILKNYAVPVIQIPRVKDKPQTPS